MNPQIVSETITPMPAGWTPTLAQLEAAFGLPAQGGQSSLLNSPLVLIAGVALLIFFLRGRS